MPNPRLSLLILLFPVLVLFGACGGETTPPPPGSSPSPDVSPSASPTPSATTAAPREAISAYFVGNSLTNGTLNWLVDDVRPYVMLAQQAGHLVQPLGWHIKCGSSLLSIFENPGDVCVDPAGSVGNFTEALPAGEWDYLVVQPYPGPGSTLATDIHVITELAQMVSGDATLMVFTGWPSINGFFEAWNAPGPINDESPTVHSRAYFDTLVRRLEDALDREVALIPTGEVLYRMQAGLASVDVPGISDLADLYSDDEHLGQPGNWLAGVTAASVMTGADPGVFYKPIEPAYGDDSEFSTEYTGLVRAVVEDVLSE